MSNRVIPWLSAREINSIDEYVRFFHTISYIKQKSASYPDSRKLEPELQVLMERCGYSNFSKYQKFRKHRHAWDNCQSNIPLSYLTAIHVDLDTLKFAISLDQAEYEQVLQQESNPKNFIVRHMACVYGNIQLPENSTESHAIEFILQKIREKKIPPRCCINIKDIKSIWFEGDKVIISYYRPEIKFTRKYAQVSSSNRKIGHTSIGS